MRALSWFAVCRSTSTDRRLYSAAVRDLEGMEPTDRFLEFGRRPCVKKEDLPPKGRIGNGAFSGFGQTTSVSAKRDYRSSVGCGGLWVVKPCGRDGPGFDGCVTDELNSPAWFRRLYSAGSSPGNNFAVPEQVGPCWKAPPPAGKLRQDLADDASGLDAGQLGLKALEVFGEPLVVDAEHVRERNWNSLM